MSEFAETTLGQLLSFSNGRTSPERADGLPYPVYGSNGILGFANEANADAGSIVIGRVGSYCGTLYYCKLRCWVTDNAIRATAINDNEPRFLFYLLSTVGLNNWRAGSGQPLLNQAILDSIPVLAPPPPVQRSIARVLGTLDDKIELNRKMNETLEAMARALFKSWFVDFEPFRDKGMQDSELGPIPKGWEGKSLPEAIEVNPPRALRKGCIAPYLDMQNMPVRGHRPDGWIEREFGSGMRFRNGDTLVARITPCLENGKTAFVDFLDGDQVGWGSTEFLVFRPKPPLPEYYGYLLARSNEFRSYAIQNMTGSSGRQRVPPECLAQIDVVVPDKSAADKFGDAVRPLAKRIRTNSEESRTLAAIRDALLPKLMSGELRVTNDEVRSGVGR